MGSCQHISVSTGQKPTANPKFLVSRLLELFFRKLASPWQLQSTLYDSTAFKVIKNKLGKSWESAFPLGLGLFQFCIQTSFIRALLPQRKDIEQSCHSTGHSLGSRLLNRIWIGDSLCEVPWSPQPHYH